MKRFRRPDALNPTTCLGCSASSGHCVARTSPSISVRKMELTYLKQRLFVIGAALLLLIDWVRPSSAAEPGGKLVPLPLQLPKAKWEGPPSDYSSFPSLEPYPDRPRPPFLAPVGVKNVALNKKVTLSDSSPIRGRAAMITDGQKEASDDQMVVLHKFTQYAQIDLGQRYQLFAVVIWHDHRYYQVTRDVIAQVADDLDFTKNVRTLFNNDQDNSSGLGKGEDRSYWETHEGKLIDAKGVKARYVRSYSRGNSFNSLNAYLEVEVYGLPID
jgi:hypothetical protein